ISLTYDAPTGTGKTTAHNDTFHGRFVKLVANEQVVEVIEFETTDLALRGEMSITYALTDADGGTDVLAVHDGLPLGVSTADNEIGWRMSLAELAALVGGVLEQNTRHLSVLTTISGGFLASRRTVTGQYRQIRPTGDSRPIPVDRVAIMPVTKRPFVECRKLTPAATLHSLSVTNAVSQRAMTNRCGWRFDLEGVSGRSLERMGLRMPDESANR